LTSNWKYIFIVVSIHKSCIVYLEKYAVPIGHGNSFFLVMEKSWEIIVEKEWSPCESCNIFYWEWLLGIQSQVQICQDFVI